MMKLLINHRLQYQKYPDFQQHLQLLLNQLVLASQLRLLHQQNQLRLLNQLDLVGQ